MSIEDDTPIIPMALAQSVTNDIGFARHLVARADIVYAHNERFRKKVRGRNGLDYLETFMRHWLMALQNGTCGR